MPSLTPSVLDTLENHDGQHDEEADAHNDGGEGEEVGVDIEGRIIGDPDDVLLAPGVVGVVLQQPGSVCVADEDAGDDVIAVPAHGDQLVTLVHDGCAVVGLHRGLHLVLEGALLLPLAGVRPPDITDGRLLY